MEAELKGSLYDRMVKMALINKESKDTDGATDWQKEILEQTWEFIHLDGAKLLGYSDWYKADQLNDYIRKNVEWLSNMTTLKLGKEFKKCHVCSSDKEHRKGIKINGKNHHCYRITKEAMLHAGKRYGTSYYDEELQKDSSKADIADKPKPQPQQQEQPTNAAPVHIVTEKQKAEELPVDDASADKICFGNISACDDPACELRDRCRAEGSR